MRVRACGEADGVTVDLDSLAELLGSMHAAVVLVVLVRQCCERRCTGRVGRYLPYF